MAKKRFTDCEIWEKDWFLELESDYMILWFWIKDKCNHAGIWTPNRTFLKRNLNIEYDLDKAFNLFNSDKERIMILTNKKWFLVDFIYFQYGKVLNPKNRVHLSIINLLENNEVKLTSIRGLKEVKLTLQDKDLVKDKGKVKDKDKKSPFGDDMNDIIKPNEARKILDSINVKTIK